jgi:hypothetical protein
MKKLFWLVVLAAAIVGAKKGLEHFARDYDAHLYRTRIELLLKNMKAGGNYEAAVCLWYWGTLTPLGGREMRGAIDDFAAWKHTQGLQVVTSFSVGEIIVEKARGPLGEGGVARAALVVNGRPLTWRLADRRPIEVVQ